VAIDDREQINHLVQYVVENQPHVKVVARAVDRDHVYDLWFHGCREIIRETYDSTLRMGRVAFEQLGIDRDTAQQMVDSFNRRDRDAMLTVAEVHEIGTPAHENEAYVNLVREKLTEWEAEMNVEMTEIRANRPRPETG
jgi:CPA2 family monovalent cation:H+ antiporter-2